MTQNNLTINIAGDIKIVVPDNLGLMTPYVLLEQEDWFEDEIKFIRKLIKPGNKIIDIGANYGTYTLNCAKLTGSSGEVWPIEPASSTYNYLTKSIKENKFTWITPTQCALSNKEGKATLSLFANSELNTLGNLNQSGENTETVTLTTLDTLYKKYKWENIDFLKLDAEGEEEKIINGGLCFFKEQSPLIMFELKHGNKVNFSLIDSFNTIGYKTYRLVKGLNILVPFDSTKTDEIIDSYMLNLFCCKNDTAKKLEKRNLLATKTETNLPITNFDLKNTFNQMIYSSSLSTIWFKNNAKIYQKESQSYKEVLTKYFLSKNNTLDASKRYSYLLSAYNQIKKEPMTIGKLCTYIRISLDIGYRSHAIQLINSLLTDITKYSSIKTYEPILALCNKYDNYKIDDLKSWIETSAIFLKETLSHFSGYFSQETTLTKQNNLFFNYEIERRNALKLIKSRSSTKGKLDPLLLIKSQENLNSNIWKQLC